MFGGGICTPALIYLIFSISQIMIDTVKGFFNTAMIKMIVTIIFTFMLNYLCNAGLGILSWIIVFIPFILMTVIVTMLLFVFNLDPKTGNLVRANGQEKTQRDLILYHEHGGEKGGEKGGECGKCDKKENPFYKIKLDDDANRGATNMDRPVSIPHIRDQRLANYL
jgi:predicted membrane protein